jgi:hypothetical protein
VRHVAESGDAGQGAGSVGRHHIATRALGLDGEVVGCQLAQVVGRLAARVGGVSSDLLHLLGEVANTESVGAASKGKSGRGDGPLAGLIEVEPPDAGRPSFAERARRSRILSSMKPACTQSQVVTKRSSIPQSDATMSPKRSMTLPVRSSVVLWTIASNRSTCSPLV